MTVIICDDQKSDLDILRFHMETFCKEQHIHLEIFEVCNPGSSAEILAIAQKHLVDAIFLDIDMPHISGDVVAKELEAQYPLISIIFYTNRDELVYDMIRYKPFRFIRKQCSDEIGDALLMLSRKMMETGHILIKIGKWEAEKVAVGEIKYVKIFRHQVIYVINSEEINTRGSMAKCYKELEEYGFIRVHVGYLVNIRYISLIEKQEVVLKDGTRIPIGGSYKEQMMRNYKIMLERLQYGQLHESN